MELEPENQTLIYCNFYSQSLLILKLNIIIIFIYILSFPIFNIPISLRGGPSGLRKSTETRKWPHFFTFPWRKTEKCLKISECGNGNLSNLRRKKAEIRKYHRLNTETEIIFIEIAFLKCNLRPLFELFIFQNRKNFACGGHFSLDLYIYKDFSASKIF